MSMFATSRRIVRRGRRGAGWFVCSRCGDVSANSDGCEVARPGNTKGVWWCGTCASELAETEVAPMADPQPQPGPHPHESSDIRRNNGMVAGWSDPTEGFKDEETPSEEVSETRS